MSMSGTPAPTLRSAPVTPAPPVCSLAYDGGELVVSVTGDGLTTYRRRLDGPGPDELERLIRRHRAAFTDGWEPRPYDLWATATEELLALVHELISLPLIEVLGPLARVALRLTGNLLPLVPVETAYRPGFPALFEVTQVFRTTGTEQAATTAGLTRRNFDLELWPTGTEGLDAIALEHTLVAAAHQIGRHRSGPARPAGQAGPARARTTERLVHVAGHEPSIPPDAFEPDERAHVVLSGCDSLPRRLPPGVASALGSLWPVDDHTNATIMAAYHSRLAGGVGPLEALRQAQFLHRSMPPATWASYVHIGDPN